MDIIQEKKGEVKLKSKFACAVGSSDGWVIEKNDGVKFTIESAGEYEVGGISALMIDKNTGIFEVDGVRVCVLPSNINEKLSEKQLSELGAVDVGVASNIDLAKTLDPWVAISLLETEGVEGVAKYTITMDRLPSELTLVYLAAKK